jgi:predicted site-specific integrase-resolvase
MTEEGERFFNTIQAGRAINVRPSTIRYWILTGKLPAEQINGWQWSIREADLYEADRVSRASKRSHNRVYRNASKPNRNNDLRR